MRKAFHSGLMLLAMGLVQPASASPLAATRLVACGAQTCLLIRGERQSADAPVTINGHRIAVEGGRTWRLRLPLDTLRAWSAPFAREVSVATDGGEGREVSLPIGLLGHTTDLAALEVRAR